MQESAAATRPLLNQQRQLHHMYPVKLDQLEVDLIYMNVHCHSPVHVHTQVVVSRLAELP